MEYGDLNDEGLVEYIARGDRGAFKQLFERHYKVLLATATDLLRDRSAAKDVVQDVFFKLWNRRATNRVSVPVIAYLKRAVINQGLNALEARKRIDTEASPGDGPANLPSAAERLQGQDVERALQQALDELPERCRTIFILRRLEGMRVKEIARQLDIAPKTVENQLTKALKRLQQAMRPFVDNSS